jgi:hypothetical protein
MRINPDGRQHALSIAISSGIAIILMLLDAMTLPNGIFYDSVQHRFDRSEGRRVLVVEGDVTGAMADSGAWSRLAVELSLLGAERVILVGVPSPAAMPLTGGTELLVGARADPDPRRPGSWLIRDQGNGSEAAMLSVAPPAQYGVHRTQLTRVYAGAERLPTLEAHVAGLGDDPPFHVRFGGGLQSLQRANVSDLLAGRVPDALVEGRTVLVGARDETGLTTSVNARWPIMSQLEYHAFALETALSGRLPRPLGAPVVAGLVFLTGILAALLYVRTGPRRAPLVALGVTLAIVAAGLAAFHLGDIVPPVGELIVSQALLSLLIWRRSETRQDKQLRVHVRTLRQSLHGEADGAEDAVERIAGSLGLRRHLVLVDRGGPRFKALGGQGLDVAALPEAATRPDSPLAQRAGETRSAVEIGEAGLYALAMRQGGKTIGLWVFEPQPQRKAETLRVIPFYGDIMAERLAASSAGAGPLRGKKVERQLAEGIRALSERAHLMEEALQRASSPVAIFDLIGGSHFVSDGFLARVSAQNEGLAFMAAHHQAWDFDDILSRLAGIDRPAAEDALRDAVLRGQSITLPIADHRQSCVKVTPAARLPGEPATALVVEISDAGRPSSERKAQAEAHPARPETADVLDALSEALAARPGAKDLIEIDAPLIAPAVDAPSDALAAALGAMLDLVLADSGAGPSARGRALVRIDEDADALGVRLESCGAGLPEGRLQEYLDGARPAETSAMKSLVATAGDLRRAGAVVAAASEVGSGLRFDFRLRKSGRGA